MALFFGGLALIFGQNETRTSKVIDNTTMGALHCTSTNPEEPFFAPDGVLENEHEIKITFNGDLADKFSYNYYGTFNSESIAEGARTRLHANYNIYMGNNGKDQESLYPTFDYVGEKVKINLFAEREKTLNLITAKLFFLSSGEVTNLKNNSADDLKKIYEKRGFSCTFKE